MDIQEVKRRLEVHFAIHNDGRETPYLDETIQTMYVILDNYDRLTERFGSFEKMMEMDKPSFEERKRYDEFHNCGFACGVHFSFFMLRNTIKKYMNGKDIIKLANWFELRHPWYNFDQWYDLMNIALGRDRAEFIKDWDA